MADPRVFFYVQHLLGIGHLRRAALICRKMAEAGLDVDLVVGGMPVPSLDVGTAKVHQLPPLRIGEGGFNDLVDEAGSRVDGDWKSVRSNRLVALYRECRPNVILTEAFPFGRRQMRFELLPLLDAAAGDTPRPRILCSVRDILKTDRKPGRVDETVGMIAQYYDAVLVHGDPRFATLDETFPAARVFADKLHYTGMVAMACKMPPTASLDSSREVVVSAGGGAVGEKLLWTALEARPLTRCAAMPWRLLAGPNLNETAFAALSEAAPAAVMVERYRSDFPSLLARCAVSVSQAGYNTVCDLMNAGARTVLVPFDAEGENEQPDRAAKLAARGLARTVPAGEVSPERLAIEIDTALDAPPLTADGFDLGGAACSAALVRAICARSA